MTILYHHRTLADGAEGVHIASMVAAFRGLGHEVRIVGLADAEAGGERQRFVRAFKGAMPGSLFELASFASNAPDYLAVRRWIREIRPDFVYKRHARNDAAALYAAHAANIPVVLEVNCLFTGQGYRQFEPLWLGKLTSACERRALRMAETVLAVSTPLAREITALAGVEAVVLPNGADPMHFDPARSRPEMVRARFGLERSLVVGWAGVIRDWHGLTLLLEAVSGLSDVRLLVVGDGPGRPAVEAHAKALGVSERLTFTGRVPHTEMRDHIAAMDIAVVAADRTGVASPMKLLEYMAMGRAIVAPDLENIRDILTDREGLLFKDGDSIGLRETLRRLLEDVDLRGRLGAAAREAVQRTRNWRRNAEEVIALAQRRAMSGTGRNTTVLH